VSVLRRARGLRAIGPALVVAAVVGLAVPASGLAHAKLVRTVPVAGSDLRRQPESVTFTFNEPIEASFGVIRVFNVNGVEVQAGLPFRPEGQTNALAVALQPDLPEGTYSASYRIVSADSYPVSGGMVFSIGTPSNGAPPPLPGQAGTGSVTSVVFWANRWLGYGAIGLAVGALFFLVWSWRPALAGRWGGGEEDWLHASSSFNRRFGWLIGGAVVVGVLASLLALPLQAASAAGTSLAGGLHADVLGEVIHTRFGSLMIARAVAWALLGAILLVAAARGRVPALRPAASELTGTSLNRAVSPELIALVKLPLASLLVSPALAGHARTQSPKAVLFPADVVHVAAMGLWLGGLAMLAAAVPVAARGLGPPERRWVVGRTASRFSGVALVAVVALAASGTAQAMVEVGSVGAFFDTGYGRIVLAKALLLGVLIGFGASNRRRLIPSLTRAAEAVANADGIWRSLRRHVRIEVVLAAVALAITAVLVSYAPPGDTSSAGVLPPQGRVSGRTTIGDVTLRYTVDPARVGLNQVNLYLLQDGQPYPRARNVRVELASPKSDTAPSVLTLERVGPGHYVDSATQFDTTGLWSLTVRATGTSRSRSDVAEIRVAIS
jgi:copper transport protein